MNIESDTKSSHLMLCYVVLHYVMLSYVMPRYARSRYHRYVIMNNQVPYSSLFTSNLTHSLSFYFTTSLLTGWLAESGIKSGPWLYRPEPSTIGYHNVTSINTMNVTISTLEPYDINNDILMRSAFSHFYQMDKIGVFKQFFATLFPILLIIVMFLVLTNVLNYILVKLKLDYLQMGTRKSTIESYSSYIAFDHIINDRYI